MIDAEDNVSSMHIWADNASISGSGNSDLAGDIVIEDGRARGTAKMTKPGEFFDKKYSFEVSFDVEVLGKPTSAAPKVRRARRRPGRRQPRRFAVSGREARDSNQKGANSESRRARRSPPN